MLRGIHCKKALEAMAIFNYPITNARIFPLLASQNTFITWHKSRTLIYIFYLLSDVHEVSQLNVEDEIYKRFDTALPGIGFR